MTDNNPPKKPGWFERWLGADDIVDQPITVEDFEKPNGGTASADSTVVELFGPSYTVTFDRVGRSRNIEPLTATAQSANELAARIYKHARPHLGSLAVHVNVDLDELRGYIMARFRNAGSFTITTGGAS